MVSLTANYYYKSKVANTYVAIFNTDVVQGKKSQIAKDKTQININFEVSNCKTNSLKLVLCFGIY